MHLKRLGESQLKCLDSAAHHMKTEASASAQAPQNPWPDKVEMFTDPFEGGDKQILEMKNEWISSEMDNPETSTNQC